MKKILCLVFFLLFNFFSLNSVFASEGWVIENFSSDISIQNDGEVFVEETIDVDFGTLEKHGIYRDIPFMYTNRDGSKYYTDLNVIKVLQDDTSAHYELLKEGDFKRIKIGEANRTINGKHVYAISYEVRGGALFAYQDYDELYWNVTGNYWDVPIKIATSTVRLPVGIAAKQIACYRGAYGSNTECEEKKSEEPRAVFSTKNLGPGEGLTVAVGYQKGAIPIIAVVAPKTLGERLLEVGSVAGFFVLLALGILAILVIWYKKGRDFWSAVPAILANGAQSVSVKPIGAKESIVVEYEPPEKLRPAIVGTLVDEKADTLDVTATIIDLATRGYLTITEEAKKWIFGKTDYIFSKKERDTKDLLSYEKLLLDRLFNDGDEVKMSKLKNKFYDDLAKVKIALYEEVTKLGLFAENPESVRGRYIIYSIGILIVSVCAIFVGGKYEILWLLIAGASFVIVGIFAFLVSFVMPRRTARGNELLRRIKGYRLFISGAEKYKQQFFEKRNMFNEILPYAIVFGLTEKFALAMRDMGIKPDTAGWYYGASGFNAATFGSSINSFSSSMSSVIASTPGSSGSGGGGFSGGGGGGGGGGSW